MPEIASVQITVNTAGNAGAAAGSASSPAVYGELLDVTIDYHADAPNTTDLTLAHGGSTFLTLTDTKTDTVKRPMVQGHDAAGSAVAGAYARILLSGPVTVTLAQCDALTAAVVVTLRIRAEHSIAVG
jgi:hypothetical protein